MKRSFFVLLFLLLVLIGYVLTKGQSRAVFDPPERFTVQVLPKPSPAPTETEDPISAFRTRREQMLFDTEKALRASLEGEKEASIIAAANNHLLDLCESRRITLLIETALEGLGYPDALCAADRESVTVFFPARADEQTALLLRDLIKEWAQLPDRAIRLVFGA